MPPGIRRRQVDKLVAAAGQDRACGVQRKALHLLKADGRWNRQLLACSHDLNQSRPIMIQGSAKCVRQVAGMIHTLSVQTKSRCDGREVWVLEIGTEVDEAGCFHLQFDEAERSVVENDHFDRKLQLAEADQLAEHHGEPAIARQRYHPAASSRWRLHSSGSRRLTAGSSYAEAILPPAILWGLGSGIAVTPLTAAVLAAVKDADLGEGAPINDAAARVGGVVMIALVPALIGAGAAASLADALAHGYQPAMIGMGVLSIAAAMISAIFVSDQRAAAAVAASTPVSEPATS
jgi:hypothetical protein